MTQSRRISPRLRSAFPRATALNEVRSKHVQAEFELVEQKFREIYGGEPDLVVRAPGRVNLIGEHTDYNHGFVLPAAIDRYVWYAGRGRADRQVHAHSTDFHRSVVFDLDHIQRDSTDKWSNYLRGVSKFLETAGHNLPGADLVFGGDVPREAGLSSSAAVELGAAAFWSGVAGFHPSPVEVVKLAQRAENEFVGVPSGIMDQFVSALGRANHALFLDCRDLNFRHVPLRAGVNIVVCNSGVKRELAHSEYQIRVRQCREAVMRLRNTGLAIHSLRDVDPAELESARHTLTEVLLKRARHVVTENERVLRAVKSLETGDLEQFGTLMNLSHDSLRDDYEVSCRELDTLVELAWKQPGVLGARMTGGGFGGCTVNLVLEPFCDGFAEAVREGYRQALRLEAEIYVFKAADGALVKFL
jgi:galactokinase